MLERFKLNDFVQVADLKELKDKKKIAQVKDTIRVFESLDDEKKVTYELPGDAILEEHFSVTRDKSVFVSKKDMRNYIEVTPKYKLYGAEPHSLTHLKKLSEPIKQEADELIKIQKKAGILFTDVMRKKNIAYLQELADIEEKNKQLKTLDKAVNHLLKTLEDIDQYVKELYTTEISEQGDTIMYELISSKNSLTVEWLKNYRSDMIVFEMYLHNKNEDSKRNILILDIANLPLLELRVKEHVREAVVELYDPKEMLQTNKA